MKESSYKVPGGKLLKISLDSEEGSIRSIRIMGDFFLHPEESIVEIEGMLVGKKIDLDSLTTSIRHFMESNELVLIGANAEDIARAIVIADESN